MLSFDRTWLGSDNCSVDLECVQYKLLPNLHIRGFHRGFVMSPPTKTLSVMVPRERTNFEWESKHIALGRVSSNGGVIEGGAYDLQLPVAPPRDDTFLYHDGKGHLSWERPQDVPDPTPPVDLDVARVVHEGVEWVRGEEGPFDHWTCLFKV